MKIDFLYPPLTGHLNPMTTLAREFQSRNHDVVFISSPDGEAAVRTNVIDGEVCVLTNVGLEHTAVLGTSHAAIAFQKLGILKRGATMIPGVAPDSAAGQIVCAEAQKLGCPVVFCLPQPR